MQRLIRYSVLCAAALSCTQSQVFPIQREQYFDPTPFIQPIALTQDGIIHFFKHYNDPSYTSRILPCCFLNITDLLSYTKDQADPYSYACTVIGLFHQRFKDCKWSNPFALGQLLEQFPVLIGHLLREDEKDLLSAYFTEQLYSPDGIHIDEPDSLEFIEKLSHQTYDYLLQTILAMSHLRQITVRFIESIIDKLVWDPRDDVQTWESFKALGHVLEHLASQHIISNPDTLNHLFWSLVYRFCYFLELAGPALSLDCYNSMQKDISQHAISFIMQPETEQLIRSKIDTLAHAARLGNAQSLLQARTLVMRQMPSAKN